jgi:hypothetical protein
MTNKEKLEAIRVEIHRLVEVRGYDRDMANDLFTFMDSLPNEPVSEELNEFALQYAGHHAPYDSCIQEVEDAVKAGAGWQKENLWKPADGDDLPEYEREVVVFTQNYPDDAGMMMVAIGHRPTPEGFDGKSLTTGEVEHYIPKTYGKGGWNIPDIVYWLDVELPKEIER